MGNLFGGGSTSSTTETSPWKPAQGALENILSQAGQLFDKNGGINAEFIEKEIADLNPEMQQAIKNLVNTQGFKDMAAGVGSMIQSGQSSIGQATGGLGALAQAGITSEQLNTMAKDLYDSELVKSQKTELGKDIEHGLAKSVQSLNQQAAGSGSMGSSRAGVAEGVMTGQAAEAYASGAADIENAARTQALSGALSTLQGNQSTALNAFGQMGQLGAQGMNAGANAMGQLSGIYNQGLGNALQGSSILQQYQQGILNNKWFNATGQQNAGWNNLNNYLGIAGTIGGMGGTSTQTGKGGGNVSQGLGSLMQGAGALAGLFSDERLKDNIELVAPGEEKEQEDGSILRIPNLYKWDWNKLAIKLFASEDYDRIPPACGCIAQELEREGFGEFVVEHLTDIEGLDGTVKVVDYNSLMAHIGMGKEEVGA